VGASHTEAQDLAYREIGIETTVQQLAESLAPPGQGTATCTNVPRSSLA